jgi:hypothetical protein
MHEVYVVILTYPSSYAMASACAIPMGTGARCRIKARQAMMPTVAC